MGPPVQQRTRCSTLRNWKQIPLVSCLNRGISPFRLQPWKLAEGLTVLNSDAVLLLSQRPTPQAGVPGRWHLNHQSLVGLLPWWIKAVSVWCSRCRQGGLAQAVIIPSLIPKLWRTSTHFKKLGFIPANNSRNHRTMKTGSLWGWILLGLLQILAARAILGRSVSPRLYDGRDGNRQSQRKSMKWMKYGNYALTKLDSKTTVVSDFLTNWQIWALFIPIW